jgi:ribonuclease HI
MIRKGREYSDKMRRSLEQVQDSNSHGRNNGGTYVIRIFTDGACIGNPGPGGWAVLILEGEERQRFGGHEPNTTNNRMELTAAIEGLKHVPANVPVEIITDSEYLSKGISEWLHRWKQDRWKTGRGKPVKNQDLWQELDRLAYGRVQWRWIRGHSRHVENETVDALAQRYARGETSP